MRTLTGAILLLTGEQAFAHSLSIGFPNAVYASDILYPASMVLAGLGIFFLLWGVLTDAPLRGHSANQKSSED